MSKNNIGVLLCNIGTPDEPTPAAVRRYLKEFLSDRRVIEIPRLLWWPILHGYILRTRPRKSAKLYQSIWTKNGSPLLHHSRQLAASLESEINMPVALGMHYGKPSIAQALHELRQKEVTKLIILPLYPQYSGTTTASTFDRVAHVLKQWRTLPALRMIQDYADHEPYINALCNTIQQTHSEDESKHLLFSFHGIPERNIHKGDPYFTRCHLTVQRIAEKLNLKSDQFSLSFQSRLGRAKWLQPYTDVVLKTLPEKGVKQLNVICPGFAVDCLETLDEIAILGKQQFLENGGHTFHYIPALNESPAHVQALATLIKNQINDWT